MISPAANPLLATGLLDWLLGLSKTSWSDPRAALAWRWPMPLWLWVLMAALAVTIAAASYRHLLGPRWARATLAATRAAILLIIVALLIGPMLVLNQEQIEPDWLVLLIDRSASMTIRDMHPHPATANPSSKSEIRNPKSEIPLPLLSRDDALRAALASHANLFGPHQLGHDRHLLWLGFDAATYEIDPPTDTGPHAEPDGQSTLLRTAIEQALQRVAGRPVSGIVLASDGRSPQSTSGDLVRRLQQQGVNVFTIPLGGDVTPLSFSIAQVEAPERAFVNDAVPVRVWIDIAPEDAAIDPAHIHVRLVDAVTGQTLDQRSPSPADPRRAINLTAQSATVGPTHWRIELVDDAPGDAGSVATQNAKRDLSVELTDKPIRVLYVEGYPRWEYRYLKNMLVREQSVESSIMLISADRDFAQEGQLPIQRLPRDAQELRPYDVIIIGDVPADYFSPELKALIVDQVANRGAGLLWIGGANDTPRSYEGTPLAGLLPMRNPTAVDPLAGAATFQLSPTPLAEALEVMRLREPGPVAGGEAGWPASLPPLRWAQGLGVLKPTAEVLAQVEPFTGGAPGTGAAASLPLVTRMRYGAGQTLYVGTDETWRWRYGRGELYFEQFWMQLIRMLGRNRLHQDNGRASLAVSNRRVQSGQPVIVTLTLNDELLIKRDLPRIEVAVQPADNPNAGAMEHLELLPAPKSEGSDVSGVSGVSGDSGGSGGDNSVMNYQAIWQPQTAGRLLLRVSEPALDDLNITQPMEVLRPDDELRDRAPDRQRMVALARDTGGQVVELDRLDDLAKLVPNRARRTPNDIREPLWNSYLAMIMVAGLLTAEWIGRKLIRLV